MVTVLLILINSFMFLVELSLGPRLESFLLEFGLIPVRYTNREVAQFFGLFEQIQPFFTSLFLHGGWLHLIGNMWILWIFGDNVEDRLGIARYLLLYLVGGICASILHILTNSSSSMPVIGASGAVAGVMGAYFLYFPHARVTMMIPPLFLGPFFVVPAVFFLGMWFFLQFFNGALSMRSGQAEAQGIAWWAHVGGFLFGLFIGLFTRRPRREEPPVLIS